MIFEIQWHPKAASNLSKLPKDIIAHILKKLDIVRQEPFRFLEHFEKERTYKLRIGEYRALVDIDFNNKILYIQMFDKRGRVYKR